MNNDNQHELDQKNQSSNSGIPNDELIESSELITSPLDVDKEQVLPLDEPEQSLNTVEQLGLPQKWLRNFLPMGIGQILSMLGSSLVQFALVWYITKETGSAISLLSATLTGTLPRVILGPFAGALVDRWNRKLTMIISDGIIALATLVLAILFATGQIQVWHIFAMLFVRSVGSIFQGPAMSASISLMIPKEHYTRYAGISQAADGIITIVSPPLGALLMAYLPIQAVLAIDTLTAAIAIALLAFLVYVPQPVKEAAETLKMSVKSVFSDVRDGFKYVIEWKGVFLLMIGGTLINMTASPAFSLLPLYVEQHFQKGPEGLAWLYSAFGIGSIVGGLVLGVWGGFKRKILTVMMGIMGMGVGMFVLGLVPQKAYGVAVALTAFLGVMTAFANGPLNAIVQEKIPNELQGRVFTVLGSLVQATVPLGLIVAAPIAELFGISIWFSVGGVVGVLIAILGLVLKPLRTLDFQGPGGFILPEYQDRVKQ
ncbi:MAG TPA: MFS transporter [Anaerolineaceae bacterium]|nr:MFS transporter [Anaerolineaceae bacterium]